MINDSNYPCLELCMVPEMFEPLRFDCRVYFRNDSKTSIMLLEMLSPVSVRMLIDAILFLYDVLAVCIQHLS